MAPRFGSGATAQVVQAHPAKNGHWQRFSIAVIDLSRSRGSGRWVAPVPIERGGSHESETRSIVTLRKPRKSARFSSSMKTRCCSRCQMNILLHWWVLPLAPNSLAYCCQTYRLV